MPWPLALVRHPAVSGGAGRCYGALDLPLADPADIPPMVAALAPLQGAAIWTSPRRRCRAVAEAIAAAWQAPPPRLDDRLQEMDFGAWEGRVWDEVPRAALDDWAADLLGFAPPGGESGAHLLARVSSLWAEIAAQGKAQVLVTHGGPLKILTALAEGRPVDLSAPAPALGAVRIIPVSSQEA
ncbi:histidine phosphatase family protein [Acidisoma sp. 7E03]